MNTTSIIFLFKYPLPHTDVSKNGISHYVLNHFQGASIPQCANGTNILISLPGSVSSEDMAVTGAGARLNGAESSRLSLLYDFEELEGELDFLTRVVTLTFYPSVSGKTPLTLGEVQTGFRKTII